MLECAAVASHSSTPCYMIQCDPITAATQGTSLNNEVEVVQQCLGHTRHGHYNEVVLLMRWLLS